MADTVPFKLKRKPTLGDSNNELTLAEHIASAHPHPNYRPSVGSGTGDLEFDPNFFKNDSGFISLKTTYPSAAYDQAQDNYVVTVKNIRNITVDVKHAIDQELPALVNDAVTTVTGDRFVEKTKIGGNYIDRDIILVADGNGNHTSSGRSVNQLIDEIGVDKVWAALQQNGIYPNAEYNDKVHQTHDVNNQPGYYDIDFDEFYTQKLRYVVYGDGVNSGTWIHGPDNNSGFLDVKSVYTLGANLSIKPGSTVEYITDTSSNPLHINVTDPDNGEVVDILGFDGVTIENNKPVIKRRIIALQLFDSISVRKKRVIEVELTYIYSGDDAGNWDYHVESDTGWKSISVTNE